MSRERQGWHETHSRSKPNQSEHQPQGGGIKSPESQPLPNVWDVLESLVRLHAPGSAQTTMEYGVKLREVNRSLDELYDKGTARDGLIQELYNAITMEPTGRLPVPVIIRTLSPEDFKQFRSKVEPMSDDETGQSHQFARVYRTLTHLRSNPYGHSSYPRESR